MQHLFPGISISKQFKLGRECIALEVSKFQRQDMMEEYFVTTEQVFKAYFSFDSDADLTFWREQLEKCKEAQINEFKKQIKVKSNQRPEVLKQMAIYGSLLARQSDFTKFINITERRFLEAIDTGDVLLFRSNDMIAPWLTRTITQSNFDHVGLILRFGDTVSDVYILEAVGDSGVRMTSWLSAR